MSIEKDFRKTLNRFLQTCPLNLNKKDVRFTLLENTNVLFEIEKLKFSYLVENVGQELSYSFDKLIHDVDSIKKEWIKQTIYKFSQNLYMLYPKVHRHVIRKRDITQEEVIRHMLLHGEEPTSYEVIKLNEVFKYIITKILLKQSKIVMEDANHQYTYYVPKLSMILNILRKPEEEFSPLEKGELLFNQEGVDLVGKKRMIHYKRIVTEGTH